MAGGVTAISLDHDLGDEHNGTGYDVVCFIDKEEAFRGTVLPMEVSIHSANPAGINRMELAIERANIFWKSNP